MVIKPIRIIILIFTIFSFALSEEININGEIDYKSGAKNYKLVGNFLDNYNYLNIKVKTQSKKNQIVLLSEGDSECHTGRKLLGMQPYGDINLFIQKNQFNNFGSNKDLYLCIKCVKEENCDYSISKKFQNNAELSIGEQYSYYVNTSYSEMKFEFKINQTQHFNIWVKGENVSCSLEHNDNLKEIPFKYGKMYTFISNSNYNNYNYNSNVILTINGKVGDYITVGSIEIINGVAKPLKVNDLEVMAVLTNELKEICFPLDQSPDINNENDVVYINGLAFTKKIQTYYKNDFNIDEFSIKKITDGIIVEGIYFQDYKSNKKYCASFTKGDNSSSVVFSLQLSSNKHINYSQLIYPPQIPGVIYPHFLVTNETAFFQGMKPKPNAKEINFNMKSIMGFPDMLFDNCNTYPDCSYSNEKLDTIIDPHHSNRMSVYSFYLKDEKEITPISSFQPLMIVKCKEGRTDKDKHTGFCIFETSIFTDQDRLKLKEAETFSQFLLKGEKDLYTIDFSTEENIQKVYLDLIVFSGDVRFKMDNDNSAIFGHKYFLSNKIFYSINTQYFTNKIIDFSVVAEKNSFYVISFQYVKTGDVSNITNIIESGTNFVESIDIDDNKESFKYVELQNFKMDIGAPFLTSFYSKNCKFMVSLENNPNKIRYVDMHGDFGQMIIEKEDDIYYEDKYKFKIKVVDNDVSIYNRKLCMIYISGLELDNENSGTQRTISLSEGVPHSFIFTEKYHTMSYSFHISDRTKPIVIDFNLIDKANYNVDVHFDYFPYKVLPVYRNQQFFIPKDATMQHCPEDEICTVNIVIQATDYRKPRRFETTVTQVNGAPIYLEKNSIKQDFLIGEFYKFYYLDIGKSEMGDITINYKRSSGNIYASIANKSDLLEINNSDWRGIYKFPKSLNESLTYESYYKKITIESKDTDNCNDGCYVLISVKSSNLKEIIFSNETDLIPYRITIIPRIFSSNSISHEQIPKVKIQVNEYIVGNVYISEKEKYYYYEVLLPYESELIYIDWQADKPALLMNVGTERPTINASDFKIGSTEHDTVLRITKQNIIEACNKRKIKLPIDNSIRYLNLTLGIYTDKVDTLYSSVYTFKIFQPLNYISDLEKVPFEIIHIRSDQKVQCDPGEQLVCLFAVIFDEGDISSNLIVYPKPQDENQNIEFYADFVDAEQIERNNVTFITNNVPSDKANFSSINGTRYIYVENVEKGKCLLMLAGVQKKTIIEVFSSTSRNFRITPNPSTPQIFALRDKKLNLNFDIMHDLLINIVCVSGEGYFYWEEENRNYTLMGYGDRLTLTSGTNHNNKLTNLVAQSTEFIWLKEDKSGFVFYITYYPRNSEYNIDQVKAGRTTEFNYREVKFPLNFFTKITDKDIAVSFNFYKFYLNQTNQDLVSNVPLLTIWGKIISEEDAFNARGNHNLKPVKDNSAVYGSSDGPFGTLFLNQSEIEKFGVDSKKNRTLFFSVEINKNVSYEFTGASLEVSILREQGREEAELYTPENVYLNGKLTNNEYFGLNYLRYKLRVDKKNPYMGIEFAANSKYINWVVSTSEYIPENSTNELKEWEANYINGRSVVTFKVPENDTINNTLYLIVFNIDHQIIKSKLSNFVFKYINANDKIYINILKTIDPNITVEQKSDQTNHSTNYILTFSPFDKEVEADDVIYYIKGIYHDSLLQEENINSIAISESEGKYKQVNNPKIIDGKIKLQLENVDRALAYIKVMAKIRKNAINEYILYKPSDISGGNTQEEFKSLEPKPEIQIEYNSVLKYSGVKLINANTKFHLQTYKLNFKDKNNIPKYIRVETNSEKLPNQILYFYRKDFNGKKERIQLAQRGSQINNVMWIKKEEFGNNDLYVDAQCQNKEGKCEYTIKFSGHDEALISGSILVYNYYVNNGNKEMEFKIKNEVGVEDTSNNVLTLYAIGEKRINLKVKDCEQCNQYTFRSGVAITIDLPRKPYINLIVTAEEGDFISLGSKITLKEGKSAGSYLNTNDHAISGYLKKNILERECYLLPDKEGETYYISGIFYNRIAKISITDKDLAETNPINIDNGIYSFEYKPHNNDIKYLCIGFPPSDYYNIKDIPYTLHLTNPKLQEGLLNIYTPQINGNIYPRISNKGSVVFFNALPTTSNSKEQIYNMISIEGLPQMYIYKCKTFPICNVEADQIDKMEGIIKPNEINSMSTWKNREVLKYNPIQEEQYIMYVKCADPKKQYYYNHQDYNVCQFQTSIFGNNDTITLVEKQPFSQYILKGEPDEYIIDFDFEIDILKIYVDVLVVSGDVTFHLIDYNTKKEVISHKYYLANKIFYSITASENIGLRKIAVKIQAKLNSFYVIEYKLVRTSFEKILNDVNAGINYLVPVPSKGENEKILKIRNPKLISGEKYLTSFYSLNCKFKIQRFLDGNNVKEIQSYGRYSQELMIEESDLKELSHSYQVTITEKDMTDYENNMCMLYVSGLELTDSNSPVQKELLVGEGIPQKIIFENEIKKVRFLYPHADHNKNIAINVNVINIANYKLKIIFNNNETESKEFFTSNVYFLEKEVKNNCKPNITCSIIFELSAISIKNKVPIIEISIRQIKNIPVYLPKGIVKKDYVAGNTSLYLFTDVGFEESGYITINFERASFKVHAKIVEKNQKVEDKDAEWRQYKFPKDKDESDTLLYDFYSKKLKFTNEETNKCINGCYILISISASVNGTLKEEYRFYPFTISVGMKQISSKFAQKINIEPEEYIIGNLDHAERIKNKELYEYYEISIPNDAEKVEFDWQSDAGILLINVGDKNPKYNNANFVYDKSRGDTLYQITKQELMTKGNINSLEKATLSIGVYTENIDSITGTVYSFKVHFYKKLNIHKVSSDQKTLCLPERLNEKEFRCLYMITFGTLDFINDVMIYSRSQSKSAKIYMYGNFIEKDIYNKFNEEELEKIIPNENSEYNTKKEQIDFIFFTMPETDKHFYVSVISDKPDIIEFVSSFTTFDQELSPNPSTMQVFPLKNDNLKLKFLTQKSLLINIVSIFGEAKLYFKKEKNVKYHLRGRDDRLSFALSDSYEDNIVPELIIENEELIKPIELRETLEEEHPNEKNNKKIEKPYFAFYIEYFLRSNEVNLDEINVGKTTEVAYNNTDFPLYYYSKLNNLENDINIFFNFHDCVFENNTNQKSSLKYDLKGSIIKQNSVYHITSDKKPQINRSPIVGLYDPAIQAGQIYFTSETLKEFKVNKTDKPTLYLEFIKRDNLIKYNKIRLELSVIEENSDSITSEKLYQFGKINNENKINSYKLKVDNSTGYMRIQFSANSPYIDFVVSEEKNQKSFANYKFEKKEETGKKFLTFEKPKKEFIYLNVFWKKSDEKFSPHLGNYVFKYINAGSKDKFFEYIPLGKDLNVKFEKESKKRSQVLSKLTAKFKKINIGNANRTINIIYTFKVTFNNDYNHKELTNSIAISESSSKIVQIENPKGDEISLTLSNINRNYRYAQVIAQINDGPINEFVSYGKSNDYNSRERRRRNTTLAIVIGIGIVLFIIVILLVILVLTFNARNKDLMAKVNAVSFVDPSKPINDEGGNLLMEGDNELK